MTSDGSILDAPAAPDVGSSGPVRATVYDPVILRRAYARVEQRPDEYGVAEPEVAPSEGDRLLEDLSAQLREGEYRPSAQPGSVKDAVVREALAEMLTPLFDEQPAWEGGKFAAWAVDAIDRGFVRVFAVNVTPCAGPHTYQPVIEAVRKRSADSALVTLLEMVLASPSGREALKRGPLADPLSNALYVEVDAALAQISSAAYDGAGSHAKSGRAGHEIVILFDRESKYDWLFEASKDRVKAELDKIHCDIRAALTQDNDLSLGGSLSVQDREIKIERRWSGIRVTCRGRGAESSAPVLQGAGASDPEAELTQKEMARATESSETSTRLVQHWLLDTPMLRPMWYLHSVELSWSGMSGLAGGLVNRVSRHWANVVVGVAGLAATVCMAIAASDVYGGLSGDVQESHLPAGFRLGQFNPDEPWGEEFLQYGVYVPPHFRREKGPFPLIVFLHGHGGNEGTPRKAFSVGLPRAVSARFGEHTGNGRFEFVVFCPIDQSGRWEAGSREVEDAVTVLDYVIRRHRIDPNRVYLTGTSNGGSGVWHMAEAYPDRWAAIAPICSFHRPEVAKVKHLPTWVFHGEKDEESPVSRQRELVRELEAAGCDVRYTELRGKGHLIGQPVYNLTELYEWFRIKSKS